VTEPAEEGVAVVEAVLATSPGPVQVQQEPAVVSQVQEEEPVGEAPSPEPTTADEPIEEKSPIEPTVVEEEPVRKEPPQGPIVDEIISAEQSQSEKPVIVSHVQEEEPVSEVPPPEPTVEESPAEKGNEYEPAPQLIVEEVFMEEQSPPKVVPLPEPEVLPEPAVKENKKEGEVVPAEVAPTEEPAKPEDPPVPEQSAPEPVPAIVPEVVALKVRKRDKVRAKALPKFPIKIITGPEIAAAAVFLLKEKAKGVDISPQLNALTKGGN
jgi:hypothetical protein